MYNVYGFSYAYTDRDGNRSSGSGEGDIPSFFVENVEPGEPVAVDITTMIVPKIDKEPILDIIEWVYPIEVIVSGTRPVIFLASPSMNFGYNSADLPVFSWINVDEADDYILKISDSETFPEGDKTITIRVGDTDSYSVRSADKRNIDQLLSVSANIRPLLYWTVLPVSGDPDIITQIRPFRMGTKVIKMTPASGENAMTVVSEPDGVYKFTISGSDPYVNSTSLGKIINPGASSATGDLTLSFEYISYENAKWEFFFGNPNAYAGGSATTDVLPSSSNWREYVFDIGQYMEQFAWGTATNHRLRIDPGDEAYGQSTDRIIYVRNFQINIK
jgi:hypothetical protein